MGQDYNTNQQGQHCCWCLLQVTWSGRSRRSLLQIKGRNLMFTGPGPQGGIQLPQHLLEAQPNRTQAIQDVSRMHYQHLPDTSDWWAHDEWWSDDLIPSNKEEQVRDVKAGKSLECSDLAMVKFKILRAVSRITTWTSREKTLAFSRSSSLSDGPEEKRGQGELLIFKDCLLRAKE